MTSCYLSWQFDLFGLWVGGGGGVRCDPLCRADLCSLGTRKQIPSFGLRSQRLGWLTSPPILDGVLINLIIQVLYHTCFRSKGPHFDPRLGHGDF